MAARKKNGQFAKGQSGNPKGRPSRAVEDRYLEALRKAISIKDLQAIFDTGFSRARAGDLGWARLICEYLIGKPVQRAEITGADGGPIKTYTVLANPDMWDDGD